MALLRTLLWLVPGLALASGVLAYNLSWHPQPREKVPPVCTAQAPHLTPGQALKVMTWNLQYLAGKRYVFWYEGTDGKDQRPTSQDLAYTLDEVTRVIRDEAPDVVLLQELDQGAKATDYQDQLGLLKERLADLYSCSAQAFDWKADFVPDRHVFGSVGRSLAILSRFQIDKAERLQLPEHTGPRQWFEPKRALLSAYLPIKGGGELAVLNTRLARYQPGTDLQRQQLERIVKRVDKLEAGGVAWLIGGDFNLLPLGQYRRLPPAAKESFSLDSDLHLLWDRYPMIPSNAQAGGAHRADWFTHSPNTGSVQPAERTLDYLIHSPKLTQVTARVRQEDSLGISDHLPLIARLLLPSPPAETPETEVTPEKTPDASGTPGLGLEVAPEL